MKIPLKPQAYQQTYPLADSAGHCLLQATDLSCERNEQLLFNNLSFSVTAGQLLHIVGENGSGKTTLLKILAGLMLPDTGSISWGQQAIHADKTNYCGDMLYIGHQLGLKLSLTPLENLRYACRLLGRQKSAISVASALERVGLAVYADIPCYYLSAGQQRRVVLAKLLLCTAKLWILDEPFTALDNTGNALIASLLMEHVQQQGLVVLTSHQPLNLKDLSVISFSLT